MTQRAASSQIDHPIEAAPAPGTEGRVGRRQILAGIFFFLGLVVLDQAYRLACDYQIRHAQWKDDPYRDLVDAPAWDVVLIGDCRALVLDSGDFGKAIGKRVRNMGASGVGLGHMAFASAVMSSAHRDSRVIFFLNDEVLSGDEARYREELQYFDVWSSHVAPQELALLVGEGGGSRLGAILETSGFWKYRGRGPEFLKGMLRTLGLLRIERSETKSNPTYGAISMAGRLGEFNGYQATTWAATAISVNVINTWLSELIRAGIKPILVVSPMHRLRANDEVIRSVGIAAKEIAARHHLPLLNYFDGASTWAAHDEWWGNPGHMNDVGARVFSDALARDIRGISP